MNIRIFGYEPAVWLYGFNVLVALAVSYGLPLGHAQVAAATTIATAVLALAVAVLTRPIVVSTVSGAIGTILTAIAAYGAHLSTDQIGTTVSAISLVLMLLLRQNVEPAQAAAERRVRGQVLRE